MNFDGERFFDRDLSWLDFNSRVLALAQDEAIPLLERLRFIAIFSSNLDEFFQVRVAGMADRIEAGISRTTWTSMSTIEQKQRARAQVASMLEVQYRLLAQVREQLAAQGLSLVRGADLEEPEIEFLDSFFASRIQPVLTPLAVDPSHPFPYVSTLSLNLGVLVRDPERRQERFARVKVPPILPRFLPLPQKGRFIAIEEVIGTRVSALFPGMFVEGVWPFRVTRNADLIFDEDEADDLLEAVEMELRMRRFGRAVRVELDAATPERVESILTEGLGIEPEDAYRIDGWLDLRGLFQICDHSDYPNLRYEHWDPVTQRRLQPVVDGTSDIFSVIAQREVLVHHPYESFASSVEALVEKAASDPHVLVIKQTLYRTSGNSPIVQSLIHAAEAGKQVVALVELKARFDEEANIGWAKKLEKAGVHVVYGIVGLKTHTKVCLIVREEKGVLRRYCHVGTGNYNSKTARIYEDFGLFSSDPDLTQDVSDLFNYLTGYSRQTTFRRIKVAPHALRGFLLGAIADQAKQGGRIVIKSNSVADQDVIEALYEAAKAGAEIDLIVRGICCLRPGVPGLSEGIRVRSIVGRFLEHSRIYIFGRGDERVVLIGSADPMTRNLDRRVESVVPIEDPALRARLLETVDICLDDDRLAWELEADGKWYRQNSGDIGSHQRLCELAIGRTGRKRRSRTSLLEESREGSQIRAAGGVVFREHEGRIEVLLVHRPRYDDWSFPKGKLEDGEDELECALREVEEETGLICEPISELPSAVYLDERGRQKVVRYWTMTPVGDVLVEAEFIPNEEVDALWWVNSSRVPEILTYDIDREIYLAFDS